MLIPHLCLPQTCYRINCMAGDESRRTTEIKPTDECRGARKLNLWLIALGAGWILLLESVLTAYRLGWLSRGWLHAAGYVVGVHFTPWVWCGYLLVLMGVLGLLSGNAWILAFRYRVLALWLWSVPAWCYFDWLNFQFMRNAATGLHAWEYQGLPASAGPVHRLFPGLCGHCAGTSADGGNLAAQRGGPGEIRRGADRPGN